MVGGFAFLFLPLPASNADENTVDKVFGYNNGRFGYICLFPAAEL